MNKKSIQYLKMISSFFALVGGIILASNMYSSKYGFIFLALSSSTICLTGYLSKDKFLSLYGGIIFLFVDCNGIYNWLIRQ